MTPMSNLGDLEALYAETIEESSAEPSYKIHALLEELAETDEAIAVIEKSLAELSATRRNLLEVRLPDEMAQLGVAKMVSEDGKAIEVKPFYSAKIKDFEKVLAYLTAKGHGGIIKSVCEVPLGRLSDETAETRDEFYAKLDSLGLPHEDKTSIHSGTLNAFVKEQMSREDGLTFPEELFDIFTGRIARVTKAK